MAKERGKERNYSRREVLKAGAKVGAVAGFYGAIGAGAGYIAYDLYYLGKTHDILGTLGNIGYEAFSWFMLGSLPHLFSKYSRQADNYIVKESSKRFLETLKKEPLEEKVEVLRSKDKRETTESFATAV